jgi:glycosyltransferase involved in cell wall biosynthesis
MILAGKVFPYLEHQRHFEQEILPLLDERRQFIGPVGPPERARLLSAARCLVIPSLIEETSSLVAMEALASATPVVALRRGSLPEVVEEGRTGVLAEDPLQLVDAIASVSNIDPRTCRRSAEARFDSVRMIESYLSLYSQLIEGLADVG